MIAADWISFRMLLAACALVGVIALFLGDAWARWRIVRTDLRRSGSTRSTDHRLGTQAAPACDGGADDRGTPAAHVLNFDKGYTSNRRQLTSLEARWRALELEGLALPPLDGERRVR